MTKSDLVLNCKDCGAALVNVGASSLCPQGCGGLYDSVPAEQNKKAARDVRLSVLPLAIKCEAIQAEAIQDSGDGESYFTAAVYRLEGVVGFFRRVKRSSTSVRKPLPGDRILVRVKNGKDTTPVEVAPFSELNAELIVAGYSPTEKDEDADED